MWPLATMDKKEAVDKAVDVTPWETSCCCGFPAGSAESPDTLASASPTAQDTRENRTEDPATAESLQRSQLCCLWPLDVDQVDRSHWTTDQPTKRGIKGLLPWTLAGTGDQTSGTKAPTSTHSPSGKRMWTRQLNQWLP
jgi:hypothetical protein